MEDLTRLRMLVALAGCGSFSREVEALAELRTGRLRVGTFGSAGAVLVVPALTEFRRRHPGVDVSLAEAGPEEVIRELRAGELELAVSYDYPAVGATLDDGLVSHHLLDDADRLVVHPGHPAAKRRRVTIAGLGRESWVVPALAPDHPASRLFAGACAAAGYEPEVAYRTNSCEMAQALVAAGGPVTLVPELALHPVHSGVVVRELSGPAPVRRVFAARRPTEHPSPATSAFLELLVDVAARHAQPSTSRGQTP